MREGEGREMRREGVVREGGEERGRWRREEGLSCQYQHEVVVICNGPFSNH